VWLERALPALQQHQTMGFLVAALLMIGGVAARLYLPITTLTPLYAAVLVGTFFSGWRAGVFAATIGFFAAWYFFTEPSFSWALTPWAIANLAIYMSFCALLVISLSALNEALARLDRQRKRLRLAMEVAKLGAWRWTPPDALEWDSSARAMLGLRPEDKFPTMEEFLSWVHPSDRAYFDEAVARTREENAIPEQEYRIITPDGQTRWLHVFTPRSIREGKTTFGIGQDVTDRKEKEDRIRALMAEVAHRVKNQYAVILALVRETAKKTRTTKDFQEQVQSRIVALSRSHDLLVNGEWIGVEMAELVRTQLEPFCSSDRCEISGPHAMLKPMAVQYLGMAIHELATNSTKYGALSVAEGRITVKWSFSLRNGGSEPAMTLTWMESGGPPPRRSSRSGFGRQVLENLAPAALGGTGKLSFARTGLVWTLEVSRGVLVDGSEWSKERPRGTEVEPVGSPSISK
jgi:PAS domain S-box-containing protein